MQFYKPFSVDVSAGTKGPEEVLLWFIFGTDVPKIGRFRHLA